LAVFIIGTNVGQRKRTGRELVRALRAEAQRSALAGEFQVRLDSRIPAAANGLTNGGGVHSPDEAPKLSYTEFPRRTIDAQAHIEGLLARRTVGRVSQDECFPRHVGEPPLRSFCEVCWCEGHFATVI
jgi:hypothetical protein